MTSAQREVALDQRISELQKELNYWLKVLKNANGDSKTTAKREVNSIRYQIQSSKDNLKSFRHNLEQR